MKLEVGMYVRTPYGISKIKDIVLNGNLYEDSGLYLEKGIKLVCGKEEMKNLKASHNIIELLEKTDLVVLEYYVAKYKKRIQRTFIVNKFDDYILFENLHCSFTIHLENGKYIWTDAKGYNPKIISILTKEQFEAMAYEVV